MSELYEDGHGNGVIVASDGDDIIIQQYNADGGRDGVRLTAQEARFAFGALGRRLARTGEYGYSLDTEVCWHGEPKALCPQCAGDQWMIPAGKPEAWGAANDQEALLHAIEACTRSRPNDGRRWAMWPAETI